MEDESELNAFNDANGEDGKVETTKSPLVQELNDTTNEYRTSQEKIVEEKNEVVGNDSQSEDELDDSMPNILIKPGEQVSKKQVSFDESKNIIKEFAKGEQIQTSLSSTENVFTSPKKPSNKKASKSDKKKGKD